MIIMFLSHLSLKNIPKVQAGKLISLLSLGSVYTLHIYFISDIYIQAISFSFMIMDNAK